MYITFCTDIVQCIPSFFKNKDILICIYIFIYVLHRSHRFRPEFSRLIWLNLQKSAILSCPMESAVSLADCFSTGYWAHRSRLRTNHRFNMVLDLQSLFGFLCTAVLMGWDPATPLPPPPQLGSYTRALLVSQDRRHLIVSSWGQTKP